MIRRGNNGPGPAPRTIPLSVQVVAGLAAGAGLWTAVQLLAPDFGRWTLTALVIGPGAAIVIAVLLRLAGRALTPFGVALVVGATAYGYLFSLFILREVRSP